MIQRLLASSFLQPDLSERDRKSCRIGCGVQEIDGALRGGVDSGIGGLTCITGKKGAGKTGLAFAFLVTHLLKSTTNQAVLVDATGTLDVLRLYNCVFSRLRRFSHHSKIPEDEGQQEAAAKVLDRVKIMRVFDFVGMVEAAAEVREKLESQQRDLESAQEILPKPAPMEIEAQTQPQRRESCRKLQRIRSTIPDSDDEDEDGDLSLLEDPTEPLEEGRQDEVVKDAEHAQEVKKDANDDGRVGMIIIDNITHVVSPMMKTNYVQASALLTSFLRSLSQLTKSHNMSTILINATMNVPSMPGSKETYLQQHGPNHMANPFASIFSSAAHLQPALSPLLPSHADLHLFITTQPLTRDDAVAQQSLSKTPSVQTGVNTSGRVSVLEVSSDRYADRVGRWAAFVAGDEGLIEGVDSQRGITRKEYRLSGFASKVIL